MLTWLVLAAVALAALFLVLRGGAGDSGAEAETLLGLGLEGDDLAALAGRVVLLAVLLAGVLAIYQGRLGRAARDLGVWALVAVALVGGYSYRDDLSSLAGRVVGELAPPGQAVSVESSNGDRAVRMRRRNDGHFVARTVVNGVSLNMLVDTGASTVVLRPADARAIGIDIDRLAYTVAVQTANGTTYAAPVRLSGVAVGSIAVPQVEALVAKPGSLRESLLGMSFLRRLRSYEFSGDFLTLRS